MTGAALLALTNANVEAVSIPRALAHLWHARMYQKTRTVLLEDCDPCTAHSKEIIERRKAKPNRIDASPHQYNAAIKRIKATDLAAWRRGFALQEKRNVRRWCSTRV